MLLFIDSPLLAVIREISIKLGRNIHHVSGQR